MCKNPSATESQIGSSANDDSSARKNDSLAIKEESKEESNHRMKAEEEHSSLQGSDKEDSASYAQMTVLSC